MSYSIKPLGPAGIIDQAATLMRNRMVLFFVITLILYVPMEIVRSVMVENAVDQVGSYNSDFTPAELEQYIRNLSAAVSPGHGIFNWLDFLLIFPFTNAALVYAISSEYLGKPVTLGQSIKAALSKLGAVIWADLIEYLALCGLGFVTIVFAAISAPTLGFIVAIPVLGASVLFCYVMVRLSLSTHVVMIEDLRGGKALERSGRLMAGNYSVYFVLGFLVATIKILIILFGAIANIISSQYLRIAIECSIEGVLYAFSEAVFLVFYFSCRCKLEQFDLTILANTVTADAAPGADPMPQ